MNRAVRLLSIVASSLVASAAMGSGAGTLVEEFGDGGVLEIKIRDAMPWLGAARDEGGFYDTMIDQHGRPVMVGNAFFGSGEGADASAGIISRLEDDGSPDPTFNDGKPVTFLQGARGFLFSNVVELGNGQILVAGMTWEKVEVYQLNFPVVCRFDEDGGVDPSFGDGGCRTLEHVAFKPAIRKIPGQEGGNGLQVQSDGKIVLMGPMREQAPDDPRSFAVVRLTADGDADMTFGTHACQQPQPRCGIAYAPAEIKDRMEPRTLAIDPADDAILVGGRFAFPGFDMIGIVKLAAGGDGAVVYDLANTYDVGPYPKNNVNDIDVLDDGSAVLVGSVFGSEGAGALVAKFDSSGSPSAAFGVNGVVLLSDTMGSSENVAMAATMQPDGTLLLGGEHRRYNNLRFFRAWRLDAVTGAGDEHFGTGGSALLLDYQPPEDIVPGMNYFNYGLAAKDGEAVIIGRVENVDGNSMDEGSLNPVVMRFRLDREVSVFSDGLEE